MSSTPEKCQYCGQPITKQEFENITKRMEREAKAIFNIEKERLEQKIESQNKEIIDINQRNSLKLDSILSENTAKIIEATNSFQQTIDNLREERKQDKLQLERAQDSLDEASDKLKKSQAELIGEIGEIQLLEKLEEYFKEDSFNTQSRGTSEADIVQTVYHNNTPLDIKICFDNKQKTMITKIHVDKAKKYQQIHNTKYVMIVSSILPPKTVTNSFFGMSDGIMLVHPQIVIEVVKLVRKNLIEIHTKASSEQSRDTKESKLYEFITGHQFALKLSVISNCYSKLDTLLKSEINSHNKNWKQRRKSLDELFHAKIDLEQEVNVITDTIIKEVKMPLDDMPKIEE